MPTLLKLYGIDVVMRPKAKEHEPPHLHIIYAEYDAMIIIDSQVIIGDFPLAKQTIVKEWVKANKEMLLEIWESQRFIKPDQ